MTRHGELKGSLTPQQLSFARRSLKADDHDTKQIYLSEARSMIANGTGDGAVDAPSYNTRYMWKFSYGIYIPATLTPKQVILRHEKGLKKRKVTKDNLKMYRRWDYLIRYYYFRRDKERGDRFYCNKDHCQHSIFALILHCLGRDVPDHNDYQVADDYLKQEDVKAEVCPGFGFLGAFTHKIKDSGITLKVFLNGRIDITGGEPEFYDRITEVYANHELALSHKSKGEQWLRDYERKQDEQAAADLAELKRKHGIS